MNTTNREIEAGRDEIAILEEKRTELHGQLTAAQNAARDARAALVRGSGDVSAVSQAQSQCDALNGTLRDIAETLDAARDELEREQTKADTEARAARRDAICDEAVRLRDDIGAAFDEASRELRARAAFLADGALHLGELRRELESLGGRHFDEADAGRGGRFDLSSASGSDPNDPGVYGVRQAFICEENARDNARRDARPAPRPVIDRTSFSFSQPATAPPTPQDRQRERERLSAPFDRDVRHLENEVKRDKEARRIKRYEQA